MTEEIQSTDADAGRLEHGVRPIAWTLQSELDARETTCKAHLWFSDPVNSAWAPLYDQAAVDAAVAAERERWRDINAMAERLEREAHNLADEHERLTAERDALKQTLHDELDENLRLREMGKAQEDEGMTAFLERVIAERDALRKDAERYRWLRAQHWSTSPLCVVAEAKDAVKLGHCCPSGEYLDIDIDAAMKGDKP